MGKFKKAHALAAKAIQSSEAVQAKLVDVLIQQKDAQTSADRIRVSTALAQTKEQLQTAENQARYSLIQLGRELYQANSLPAACEEHRNEIVRIKTALQ